MSKRLTHSLVGLLASASVAGAVSGQSGAFAPWPVSARGAALGGAQTAAPKPSEALFLNPAGLAEATVWEAGYHHANAYGLLPLHQVQGVYHPGAQPFWFGAGWKQQGDEVYAENEVRLGAAYRRDYMKVGLTWNLRHAGTGPGGTDFIDAETGLNHRVDATALGFMGFDAGAIAQPFGPRYALGVVFRDVLSRLQWSSDNEAGTAVGDYAQYVPITLRFGLYAHPDDAMAFQLDFEPSLYHDGFSRLAVGIENLPLQWLPDSRAKPYVKDMVALRLGYARNMFTTEAFHRLGLGGGLKWAYGNLRLDADMAYEWVFAYADRNNLRFGFSLSR